MEITNEMKINIFGQYIGQKCRYNYYPKEKTHVLTMKYGVVEDILILNPLSSITNEDALELIKIYDKRGWNIEIINKNATGIEFKCMRTEHSWFKSNIYFQKMKIEMYQFLQSKGYDLPQYLLGGKTLKECGLAIYKEDLND